MDRKIYSFTILGNQENDKGNPIPYTRTTQRGRFRPDAQRYARWKKYVLDTFLEQNENVDNMTLWKYKKPIEIPKQGHAHMDIVIYWANNHHGDPDNVFKGIADALFVDDKEVYGTITRGALKDKKPRVEVKIIISN